MENYRNITRYTFYKKYFLQLFIGICAFMLLALYFIIRADYDTLVIQKERRLHTTSFELKNRLNSIKKENLGMTFPWKDYLDSTNIDDVLIIKKDLAVLDSFTKSPSTNRQMLSDVLTNKLNELTAARYQQYNADTLLQLVQWAEDFKGYANLDPDNDIFYESICSYWLSFVTNKLAEFSKLNRQIKYSFKYKYLVARCHEYKFTTPVKVSKTEKVAENFTNGKWAHLTDAAWNQTTVWQKLIFLIILIITGYGYLLIIHKIIKKWKK